MEAKLQETLNQQIANWSALYIKLHNYHWYVKGQQFFTLHIKFEELYTEAALHIDTLAERLLALNGKPVARMSDILKLSSIEEATGEENAEHMVQVIVEDFSKIILQLKAGMELAEESNDETTGDMLLAIHSSLEKHVWMLSAYLGK